MIVRTGPETRAIIAILSAMALVVLDTGMAAIALPTIARDLGVTPDRTILAVIAYQLSLLIGLLPCAQIADRIGHRRLFSGGLLLFAFASVLSAAAPALELLAVARAVQGLGGAAVLSLGIALLRRALGEDRLGTAIAWNALVVAFCSVLAPLIGALLLSAAGWRWLFLAGLPMAGIALICARALPVVPPTRRSVDGRSIILYAGALASGVAAASLLRWAPATALLAAVGAASSALLLHARQRRQAAPLIPLDLLAMRPFRSAVAASALLFTSHTAGLLAMPFHLQFSLQHGIATTGVLIALWPLSVAATSRLANRLADRFACQAVCTAGGLVLGTGLAAITLLSGRETLMLVPCLLLCGIGFGLFQIPNNRILFLSAPLDRSAAAGGLQGTARLAGQTAGALLVAFVLSAVPLQHSPSLAIGLAAFAALAAALVSWAGRRTGHWCEGPPAAQGSRRVGVAATE